MAKFVQVGFKNPKWLASVNRCRLFLQVARVSDIVTVNGKMRDHQIFVGQRRLSTHEPQPFEWPTQGRPSAEDWSKWHQVSATAFDLVGSSKRLACPLDRWRIPWTQGKFFLSNSGQLLIKQPDSSFQVLKHGEHDFFEENTLNFWTWAEVVMFAAPLQRVDLVILENCFLITSVDSEKISRIEMESSSLIIPQMNFDNFCCHQVRHETSWINQLEFIPMPDEVILELAQRLQTPGVRAVSDGSPKDGKGAAAWIVVWSPVETQDFDVRYMTSGGFRVPGPGWAQDSYLWEMAGLLAILGLIRSIIRNFHLQYTYLTIVCDGKGALHHLFAQDHPSSYTDSQWDLVVMAQTQMSDMPGLEITWRHVKGHQDQQAQTTLDSWAELNVIMDSAAKNGQEGINFRIFHSVTGRNLDP